MSKARSRVAHMVLSDSSQTMGQKRGPAELRTLSLISLRLPFGTRYAVMLTNHHVLAASVDQPMKPDRVEYS